MTSTTSAPLAEPLVLTAEEVAELFGRDSGGKLRVSARTITRHAKEIPGLFQLGSKKLWKRGPLIAWLDGIKAGTVIPFSRSA